MGFRMQSSVPELADLSKEPASVFDRYGPESRKPGTFAANCMLARRLAERGVRFIQLYHRGWDQHSDLPEHIRTQCYDTDQPGAALVEELKERGLLDETLVIWGGEFGRGVAGQGQWDSPEAGRDHHPRCFTMWMAGGGVKGGMTYGATDDWGYYAVENKMEMYDLHATVLHLMGVDHTKLTYRFGGRDMRLTDVHGVVQTKILA